MINVKTTLDGAKTTLDAGSALLGGDAAESDLDAALRSEAIYSFNRTGTIKRSEVAAIVIRMMDPGYRVGAPADPAMVNK